MDEAGLVPMRIESMCVWDERNELRRAMPGCRPTADVPGEAGMTSQKSPGAALRGYLRTVAGETAGVDIPHAASLSGYLRIRGKALAKKLIMEALGVDPGGSITFRALPANGLMIISVTAFWQKAGRSCIIQRFFP